MANLTHLFKVGQKVRYNATDFDAVKKWYKGEVKEVFEDHLIVDIPEISDHMWFEADFNLDTLYPEYNF